MSAVTRPRGPLPAQVYWRRRALVLVVAFVLVFTLARVLGGGSDGDGGDPDRATPAAGTPTDTIPEVEITERLPEAQHTEDTRKPDSRKPRKAKLATADGPCDPESVTIRADATEVASSPEIRIPLKLSTSVPACTFEVSHETVVVKITSGSDNIWSSQQCRGIETRDVVVRAEKPAWARLVWNGRRSGVACGRAADWALPGWYHLVAAPMGGEPTDKMFELTPQKREVIVREKRPEKGEKKSSGKREEKKGQRRG